MRIVGHGSPSKLKKNTTMAIELITVADRIFLQGHSPQRPWGHSPQKQAESENEISMRKILKKE